MNTAPDDSEPRYTTCACQHCDNPIEFDASEFGVDESRTVECPHCHSQTEVFVATPSTSLRPPPIPTPPVYEPEWIGCEASRIHVRTTSGTVLEIKEVRLYDELELKQIGIEKSRVTELMGGSQSPFGFFGDAFWVISNVIVQNYVSQRKSDKMAKEGLALIDQISKREQKLRSTQTFFHVGRIENVDYPAPSLWRVTIPGRPFGFIHCGDDFVTAKDLSGKINSLRWSTIEQYTYDANK